MTRSVTAAITVGATLGQNRLAWAIIVTREDGTVYRWTTHGRDRTISGNVYSSQPGIDIRSLVSSAGFGVDNTEVEILADDIITRADLIAGRWDAAAFTIGLFDWVACDGVAVFMTGNLGNLQPRIGKFVTELRDIRQSLQQDTTDTVQADCRYRLGDEKCTIELAESDGVFVKSGNVTTVDSRYAFRDSAQSVADDFFGNGEVRFNAITGGLNAGLRFLVRDYFSATKQFVLATPTPFTITNGDDFLAIAGCRKRAFADCRDKFNNIVNFGGEPDKARVDFILRGAQ